MISDREDFTLLEKVYENDEAYLSKVRLLKVIFFVALPLSYQAKKGPQISFSSYAAGSLKVKYCYHFQDTYESLRRVRPDGNCFFRAVGFAYLEQLLKDKSGKLVKFMEKIKPSKEEMSKQASMQ